LNPFKKILWAVDPFPETPDITAQSARAIQSVATADSLVEPAFVLRPREFELESNKFIVEGKDLIEEAEKNVRNVPAFATLSNVRPMKYITASGNSLRLSVTALLEYAVDSGATLIAVCTHARKGMHRLFLGSFAESLIFQSPIPVLITNPSVPLGVGRIEHMLYPTDFTETSRAVFQQFLSYAKTLNVKVVLFNKFEYAYVDGAYPFVPLSVQPMKEVLEAREKTGREWIEEGKEHGVDVRFLHSKSKKDVASTICRAAGKLASSMIVMVSQTGPVVSAIMGSTTRQVIRQSRRPVLVLHPEKEAAKLKQSFAA
jgi:nucleotide-binding universal stress UspA family protein